MWDFQRYENSGCVKPFFGTDNFILVMKFYPIQINLVNKNHGFGHEISEEKLFEYKWY